MDPFETKKIHPGATGLVDNWRLRLAPAPGLVSPQLSHTSVTPEWSPGPSTPTTTPTPMLTPTPTPSSVRLSLFFPLLSFSLTVSMQVDDGRQSFMLTKVVNRHRVFPGIKDLPHHIRADFRNAFIRPVMQSVFNSSEPWVNPDLSTLQNIYDSIYPVYPARLQPNDAVFHPVRQ